MYDVLVVRRHESCSGSIDTEMICHRKPSPKSTKMRIYVVQLKKRRRREVQHPESSRSFAVARRRRPCFTDETRSHNSIVLPDLIADTVKTKTNEGSHSQVNRSACVQHRMLRHEQQKLRSEIRYVDRSFPPGMQSLA